MTTAPSPTANATAARPGAADTHATATGTDAIARLEGVSKSFGSLHVLRDLTLAFAPGQTTVVLGPSGTGKSVMLKHIMGLLRPDAGAVYFKGTRVDPLRERELVEIRKQIGFLFQMGALFDSMTVGANVAFPLAEHTELSAEDRSARAEELLRQVGLPDVQHKMPAEMSGGQRKRVALARAIALNPDLVLYDEPTTGLDPITSDVINQLINATRDRLGLTNIVVTHDIKSATTVADRMVLLSAGRIVHDGPPEAFVDTGIDTVDRFIRGEADAEDLAAIRAGMGT